MPSLVGTLSIVKGFIPSKHATLNAYSSRFDRLWWCVYIPQVLQKKCFAVWVLNWYSVKLFSPLRTRISARGTDAAMAPLLRHIEQSQRRVSTKPLGRCISSTTASQWHDARWDCCISIPSTIFNYVPSFTVLVAIVQPIFFCYQSQATRNPIWVVVLSIEFPIRAAIR